MVDTRNIKFLLNSDIYQLTYNPKKSKMKIFKALNILETYDKLESEQFLGYIIEFELEWVKNVPFDETQRGELLTLFKANTSFYVYPNPDAEPTMRYLVKWKSDFDFESSNGWFDGFGEYGKIVLLGQELLQNADLSNWTFNQYSYT